MTTKSETQRFAEALRDEYEKMGYSEVPVIFARVLARLYPAPPPVEIEVVESDGYFKVKRGDTEYDQCCDVWGSRGCGACYYDRDIAEAVAAVLRKREEGK